MTTRQTVAESLLGSIEWKSCERGFCVCPGLSQHTKATAANHTLIYLDGTATLYCTHRTCSSTVAALNKKLRRAIESAERGEGVESREPTAEEIQRRERAAYLQGLKTKAQRSLSAVIRAFTWPEAEIAGASRKPIPAEPIEQFRAFLQTLFISSEVVWIGNERMSGSPAHAHRFRTVGQWLTIRAPQTNFVSHCTFRPGSYSRSKDNIERQKFMVVESDELGRNEVGAVFRWLRESAGLRLRAVVFSGNKSLHGWFEWPSRESLLEELKATLTGFKCDPATLRPSQPVRLPGAYRADKGAYQRLIYLD